LASRKPRHELARELRLPNAGQAIERGVKLHVAPVGE
jgi:hypothetical protein